ncbi:response regulator [Clostridium chrysemydis]|uniref:response regulator n=1 Tax=Clostridium chrysemydis TaxID=2665504 RepID=UPI0018845E6D|nr:response regulator [Clostridium chrysemydis]
MKTALVVDDTKNIRLLLSKSLESDGFIVHSANNATEALNLVKEFNFDIAFIDIKMPNVSGTALLQMLRDEGYDFPVVIMTAFGTIKNAVTTTQLGAKAYLQKPFTSNTIRKTLSEVFEVDIDEINKKDDTFNLFKDKDIDDFLAPNFYLEISEKLKIKGDIEKAKLFKDFSFHLKNLN